MLLPYFCDYERTGDVECPIDRSLAWGETSVLAGKPGVFKSFFNGGDDEV